MDDGVVLRADVFRPTGAGKHPVILSYGPYAKGLSFQEGYKGNWARLVKAAPEVLQIDDSYVPRGPDFWKFPPGRSDQWGVTNPPTTRLARIQQLFRFSDDGFRT